MSLTLTAKSRTQPKALGKRAVKVNPMPSPAVVDSQANWGGLGVRPTVPIIQTKLKISEPNDQYEQEAERVAEELLRIPARQFNEIETDTAQAEVGVQRTCQDCEQQIQRSPVEREKQELVNSSAISGLNADATPQLSTQIQSMEGLGQPLPKTVRSFFEPRFSHNFDGVRIHRGTLASDAANQLGASAFTVGHNIMFGNGQYAPETPAGKKLLAHELTHTIQQGATSFQASQIHTSPTQAIMPYRRTNSANFGACDTHTLQEESFNMKRDKTTKPWIEKIDVQFNGVTTDTEGDSVPTGNLTATYFGNSEKLSDITASIVGGKASAGLTNQGSFNVKRIEGCGYHHTSVPKAERIAKHKRAFKYFKDPSKATMSFAVFFLQGKRTGNQAIHEGSLSSGSLACVHIEQPDIIRQINYHSVKSHTKVEVSYASSPLQKLCCERHQAKGYMVSNPCKGQDPKKC